MDTEIINIYLSIINIVVSLGIFLYLGITRR